MLRGRSAVWSVLMQVSPEPPLDTSSKGRSQAQPCLSRVQTALPGPSSSSLLLSQERAAQSMAFLGLWAQSQRSSLQLSQTGS